MTIDFESGDHSIAVRNTLGTPSTGLVICLGASDGVPDVAVPSAAGLPSAGLLSAGLLSAGIV